MRHFRIKVCGITRPRDAKLAADFGADLIGLIFYRYSPRKVTIRQAKAIIAALPPTVNRVGVFVDEDPVRVIRIAERLRLDFVQLSGDEPVSAIRALQKTGLKVIKVFHGVDKATVKIVKKSRADLVMIDNSSGKLRGGTGKTFDWSKIRLNGINNLVLAGGINSDNAAAGLKRFEPLVIDVNSGVESTPGFKSGIKLKRFFKVCDKMRYGS